MVPKRRPPFRAEHIGSLLRPDYLLEARRRVDKKEISREQLQEIEDRAVVDAINLQREVGIKGFTDGEYRRHMFYDGFFENLEGVQGTTLFSYDEITLTLTKEIPNPPVEVFRAFLPQVQAFVTTDTKPAGTTICTSKIRHVKSGYVPQFEALKKFVHPDEVGNIKMTIASPEWLHLHHGKHAFAPGVYNDEEAFFKDIAAAYRQELALLYAAGCRNVQIDAPLLSFFCDRTIQKGFKDDGEDADALLDAYIRLYNDCIAERPRDMVVGLHLCRGNFRHSIHFTEGGYDVIAKKVFNNVNVDCYYLEYDTPRAGTFEPLKHLPKHKSVVLGLVTSKFPEMEDAEVQRERVFEAARIVAGGTGETVEEALQRISVSPQCGFASHEEGNLLTAADMKRKLEFVRDLAASIWADV